MIQYKFGQRVNASPSSADAVKYDNSISGLEATTVQGAVDKLNNNLTNINNNQIKYKTLEFDATVGSNAPIAIYNYSDDKDLKNAEIVGIVPTQMNFFTTVSLYNLNININTKEITILVSTGQRVSGYYSVLYR